MAIRLLSEEVASQIAAGEVIERPASVVKELVENSLDAKATSIEVRVEGGGVRLIEVIDDGCGIEEADFPLAVMRHATSKLSSAQDLFNIATLGFRGEALASIASVARVTLISHAQGSERAALYVVEGGKSAHLKPHPHPKGTLVRVEDLFFNVPARRKFLKKESTEKRVIEFLCSQYAVAFPQVRFKLQQDRRLSFQTTGTGDWIELLSLIFGRDTARQLLRVEYMEDGISLQGFISPFNLTSSHRNDILFYVNQRPIKDTALVSAFIKAYHGMLMVGRYPLGVLFITLPVHEVDVNVHPTKAEVRFRDKERIFAAIIRAVRRTLISYSPIPQVYPSLLGFSESFASLQTQHPATEKQRAIDPAWQFAHEDNKGEVKPAVFTSQEGHGDGMLKGFVQIPLLRRMGK
jgi:DNA mismatch repair protein MutL